MLKPNAAILARQAETADLIAKFQAAGGVINKIDRGVAGGLKRRKYLRKAITVKTQEA